MKEIKYEKITVAHKDKDYTFKVPADFDYEFAADAVEILLKVYSSCGWVNPVYATITGGNEGPVAVAFEPLGYEEEGMFFNED